MLKKADIFHKKSKKNDQKRPKKWVYPTFRYRISGLSILVYKKRINLTDISKKRIKNNFFKNKFKMGHKLDEI